MSIDWQQEVEIMCVAATMKYYRDKGYNVPKQLTKFIVIAYDLPLKSSAKIKATCDVCGITNEIAATHHSDRRTDYMCHKCASIVVSTKRIKPANVMTDDFTNKTGLNIVRTEGIGAGLKIIFIAKCGHEANITYRSFKRRGINGLCAKCFKESMANRFKFTIENVRQIFKDGNCELLSSNYINNRTNLKYRCECGNVAHIKLDKFQKGDRCGCKQNLTGKDAARYNPNLTEEDRIDRRSMEGYKEWRKSVYERDNYTCQCCGKHNVKINAHHMESYATNKDLRMDINNGITLCSDSCHKAFHMIYGIKNNTREQLMEFIELNQCYHVDNLGIAN